MCAPQSQGPPAMIPAPFIEAEIATYTIEGRQAILDFVDKFLTTELPDRDAQPDLYKFVRKYQWHTHTFTCSKSKPIVRIRRGKKELIPEQKREIQDNTDYISGINRNNEDEIYEKIDPDDDPDLIQTKVERREFFERARCPFGKPDPLAAKTHFRTHKEARILTRGDRDIIMKRTTEESRRIVPYNINLLKTFKCNHDMQIVTDPWAAADGTFLVFLLEPEIYDLHQVLLQHKIEISTRILTLHQTYRIQLKNLLDHLINIDKENFKINHRESYIFTNPIEHEDDTIDKSSTDNDLTQAFITTDNNSFTNFDTSTCISFQALSDLRNTANPQQKYLLDFIQTYLNHLLMHSRRPTHVQKPKPFHIVVNGLAGSGKSYVISIIEKMLNEYCIAESAGVSRPRKNFGLLKMAHTGKAALNIHGSTIHSALEICPDGSSSPNKLNSFKFHTLRNKLNGLLLIIIDEILLVSHALFQKINKRLNEIFRTLDKCDVYFGGIPVIVFGDMAQIEPVAAKQVFYRPLGELFSLWHDLFRPINFDINMRQGDDRVFFDCCLDEDTESLIKSRSIRQQDNPESYQERLKELNSPDFQDAVHAIPDPNLSYTSNVNNTEKKNKRSRNNSKHTNKRLKVINNININDATNVDDDTNMVNDIIKPENVIICERQRRLFCGGHALRALVQDRQIFDDTYLISLAEELATQELILRPRATTVRQYYFNYITGYYHIEVIQKALQQQYNIELLQLQEKDETTYLHRDLIRNHIHDVQALFVHQHDHYFCVRRFDSTPDYFFIIDSLTPGIHETIPRHRINDYFKYLYECDSSIYVPLRGDMLKMETISYKSLLSLIHPLPTCVTDELVLTVNESTNFIF
ncbi:unnamed protein product [Rotaria sp. Silwood2]|nr:unnamed protein product [Rotaria sp. Silwood2]